MKHLLTILLFSVVSCPSWAQEHDPELQDRFLQGVAETAQELEQLSFRAKCVYTSQMTEVSETWREKYAAIYAEKQIDPHEIDTRKFEAAIHGTLGLKTGVRKSGNIFFEGRNNAYAFLLERSPEGKRPSLQFVEQLGIDPATDARIAELEGEQRALILAAFSLWAEPLPRLLESDAFSIKRVYAVSVEANELVRVEFEHMVYNYTGEPDCRITDGYMICDPNQKWALTEYGGTRYTHINKSTSESRVILKMGESANGLPIATKVSSKMTFPTDPGTTIESEFLVEVTSREVPEEEFYLNFYDLSEPNFKESWFGTSGWYLIGGIGCILIGVVIKWRMT